MFKLINRMIYDNDTIVGYINQVDKEGRTVYYGCTKFGNTFGMESVQSAFDEATILVSNPEKYAKSKENLRFDLENNNK